MKNVDSILHAEPNAMSLIRKLLTAVGLQGLLALAPQKPAAAEANSQRAVVRKRQRLQDAFIVSEGMLAPRACTLREMTPLGGSIEVWDGAIKPSLLAGLVTLYLPGDHKEIDCAVKWRRENAIGFKFVSGFRPPRRAYR